VVRFPGTGKTFINSTIYQTDFVFRYDYCLMGNRDTFPGIQQSVRETEKVFFFLSNATTCSPELRGLPSGGGVV
jgi:hypothetical protein